MKNKSARKKQILIVDDHPMMREGLAQLISQEPDLAVAGDAGTAREALELASKLKPDLMIVDITLPDKNGLELIKDLHAMHPQIHALVLSMHDESLYAERVLRAGGRGYVMKQQGGQKIMAAVREVLAGNVHVSEKIASKIVEIFSSGPTAANTSPVGRLTDREFQVFQLIGKGRDLREIAAELHLSVRTAEVHRANIKQKLDLKSVADLIRYAVRWTDSTPSNV